MDNQLLNKSPLQAASTSYDQTVNWADVDPTDSSRVNTGTHIPTAVYSTSQLRSGIEETPASTGYCERVHKTHPAISQPSAVEPTSIYSPPSNGIGPMRDRWLYPYLDQSPARYAVMQHSMMFLCRVFRTYPKMMSRKENLPPFIHPAQISEALPLPLANCFTLSRMWEGRDGSRGLMEDTVGRELNKLFNEVTL